MNKTKMTLAAIGGATGLAVLTMAFFTWCSFSAKTAALEGDDEEGTDGLETVVSRAQTLSRAAIYPSAASLREIESNKTLVVEWRAEAKKLATAGDRVYPKTTPAKFKTDIVADAQRLAALPGAAAGVLVKPDFAFGPFKDYIAGGKMPADSELVLFQRKWDDVATIVEILAKSGIAELTDVQFAAAAEAGKEEVKKDQKAKARGNKKGNKGASDVRNEDLRPQSFSYVFSFTTKQAGLVKVLNAFVVSERFIIVDGLSFSRPQDTLTTALGGEEKTAAAQPSGRRGRRGRRGAAEAEMPAQETAAAKNGIVTDPQLDAPLAVVLTVTVSDFRSLEDEKSEEEKK